MPSRAQLELQAAALNINPATYPNDSKLEQAIIYAERTMTAKAGTATTLAPSATVVAQVAGGANV